MDIGKLLALGAAGYFGYRYFLAPGAAAVAPVSAGGIQPGVTPGGGSVVTPVAPVVNPLTTQAMVQDVATRAGFTAGNVDQWNYYYGQARGIPAKDPLEMGFDDVTRLRVLTFPEWWATASSHGMSGGYVRYGRGF